MRWRGAKVLSSTCPASTAVSSSSSNENSGTCLSASGLHPMVHPGFHRSVERTRGVREKSGNRRNLVAMQKLASNQMLQVGLEFAPEIRLSESNDVHSREFPGAGMIEVLAPRMTGVDDHAASDGGNNVGERHVIAARRLDDKGVGQGVFDALPNITAV